MSEITTGARAVLARPGLYELWSSLVGGRRGRSLLVREHVRPQAGERILDLGCGPGELLAFLPANVSYLGVDISADYIARARERFGDRGEFRVGDATSIELVEHRFDLVLAFGVLHHLEDDDATGLLDRAASVLEPDGRIVAVDPTITGGQSRIARAVILRDRGQHVRSPEEYRALVPASLGVRAFVRSDVLTIPYTHCILECARLDG